MTVEDLSARLERVERQNRRMKAGGIVTLVLLAAGVAMGQEAAPPKVVKAERFEVIDQKGNLRAHFGLSRMGSHVALELADVKGMSRATLVLSEDGTPNLWLSSDTAQPIVSIGGDSDGLPWVRLRKPGSSESINLGLISSGEPQVELTDGEGVPRAVLGTAFLPLRGEGPRTKTQPSSFLLFDKDGKVIERLPK